MRFLFCLWVLLSTVHAAPKVPTPLKQLRDPVYATVRGTFSTLGDAGMPASFTVQQALRGEIASPIQVRLDDELRAALATGITYVVVFQHLSVDRAKNNRLKAIPAQIARTDGASPAVFFAASVDANWFQDVHAAIETDKKYRDSLREKIVSSRDPAVIDLLSAELLNAQSIDLSNEKKTTDVVFALAQNAEQRATVRTRAFNALAYQIASTDQSRLKRMAFDVLCEADAVSPNKAALTFSVLSFLNRENAAPQGLKVGCVLMHLQTSNPANAEQAARLAIKLNPSAARQSIATLLKDPVTLRDVRIALVPFSNPAP